MLKADIHIHTGEDDYHPEIKYGARKLIDSAAKLGFSVISITNHSKVTFNKSISRYAAKKGILLIPGAENRIEGKDVLIYNITNRESQKIKTFEDLEKLRKRKKNILVVAPHPFYPASFSLGKRLLENISLFDAVEYSHFYFRYMNKANKKASRIAHEFSKPMVGTSDAHHLWRLNTTYTLIDSKKTVGEVIKAIKRNKVTLHSTHLDLKHYLKVLLWLSYSKLYRKLYKFKAFL